MTRSSPIVLVVGVVGVVVAACGGRVSDGASSSDVGDGGGDSGVTFTDVSFVDVTSDVSVDDVSPADVVVDASISCDGYEVTGAPGPTPSEPPICGDSEPYPGWAEAMLACLVDRCDAANHQPPWCGTISLSFDALGTTTGYLEDGPGTGGCVKYQGFYRSWPCEASRTVAVTRSCP